MQIKRISIFSFSAALVLFSAFLPALGEEGYVYDARGKRDPFVPLVGVTAKAADSLADIISIEDVKLQGIALDSKGRRVAIINGEMISEGATAGRLTLKKISNDTITILIENDEYKVNIYQETDIKNGGKK